MRQCNLKYGGFMLPFTLLPFAIDEKLKSSAADECLNGYTELHYFCGKIISFKWQHSQIFIYWLLRMLNSY